MTDANSGTYQLQAESLRAYSQYVVCPKCNKGAYSVADQRWNIIGVISCIFCGACWWGFIIFKKKDLACYDTEHKCQNSQCNEKIGDYKGCL